MEFFKKSLHFLLQMLKQLMTLVSHPMAAWLATFDRRRSIPLGPIIRIKSHPKSHVSINPCQIQVRRLTPLCHPSGPQEVEGGGDEEEDDDNDDKNDGTDDDDKQPLGTVRKLYNSIKDRDIQGLSELIGEECREFCNFVPAVNGPLEGKTQVLELLSMLMRSMGDNVVFVVKPSFQNGLDVTVEWQLEWEKTGRSIGKGYSFYTVHVYKGKVIFRNLEMIMEPLLKMEPLRLKIIGFFMPVDEFTSRFIVDKKVRMIVFFCLLLVVVGSITLSL